MLLLDGCTGDLSGAAGDTRIEVVALGSDQVVRVHYDTGWGSRITLRGASMPLSWSDTAEGFTEGSEVARRPIPVEVPRSKGENRDEEHPHDKLDGKNDGNHARPRGVARRGAGAEGAEPDEIMTSIRDGIEKYEAGKYPEAAGSLEYAAQMIRTKRAEAIGEMLPEPLEGWQAKKVEATAVAASMLGGVTTASRKYSKGKSNVEITFVIDSPAIGMMSMLFTNPAMAAQSGKKMKRFGEQSVLVTYDEERERGELQTLVVNRILVTVKGRSVMLEDLEAYLRGIDFAKLESAI